MPRRIKWPVVTKEKLLFLTGLLLTINEGLFHHGDERPAMLVLFGAMMGLPAFMKSNEEKKQAEADHSPPREGQRSIGPGNGSRQSPWLERTSMQFRWS